MFVVELLPLLSTLVTKILYTPLHHVVVLAYVNIYLQEQAMGHTRNRQYLCEQYISKVNILCAISAN